MRKFPSPFEQELKEAEDKYSQSQAGLVTLSKLNIDLKETCLGVRGGRGATHASPMST